ncbi:MAG: hypothetical protein WDW38_009422 [Sanguina aurantia]
MPWWAVDSPMSVRSSTECTFTSDSSSEACTRRRAERTTSWGSCESNCTRAAASSICRQDTHSSGRTPWPKSPSGPCGSGTLVLLDQWAVQQAYDVQLGVIAAYERYDFPEIVQRVQNFCTNELGALYLDITKDRLYTMPTDSVGRRSAQSAMYRIVEAMVRWLAPVLSFTAEEIWQAMPPTSADKKRSDSVLFETWYDGLAATQTSPEQRLYWSQMLAIREGASRLFEGMRNASQIGGESTGAESHWLSAVDRYPGSRGSEQPSLPVYRDAY